MPTIKVDLSRQVGYYASGGFQFVMVNSKNETMHQVLTCKDYLQNYFYIWYTGEESYYPQKYEDIDLNSKTFKLALIAPKLNDSRMNMRKLLNQFEDALGIPRSWIFRTVNPDIVVVKFSKEWTSNPLLLSSMATILRMSSLYRGESVLDYFKSLKNWNTPQYMKSDISRMNLRRIAALLKGVRPELSWKELGEKYDVHGTGMINYTDFPEVDVD